MNTESEPNSTTAGKSPARANGLTETEAQTVRLFLDRQISSCDKTLEKLKRITPAQRPAFLVKNIEYWEHVRSGLLWARHNARERYVRSPKNAG